MLCKLRVELRHSKPTFSPFAYLPMPCAKMNVQVLYLAKPVIHDGVLSRTQCLEAQGAVVDVNSYLQPANLPAPGRRRTMSSPRACCKLHHRSLSRG